MVSGIYAWRHQTDVRVNADPRAIADLKRRQSMPETRDLTGILQGDPPAGRSALDQKRERERRVENPFLGVTAESQDGQDGEGR
ncbi:MAG: hypothetical protein RL299_1364 [Pseudomonadota bacterium]|jgi:hypothetical protein